MKPTRNYRQHHNSNQCLPSPKDPDTVGTINVLPPEIIGEIMYFASHNNPNSPLVLSHVCFRWKAVAQGFSSLWWNLDLDLSKGGEINTTKAKHWIGNAKETLLDVKLIFLVSAKGRKWIDQDRIACSLVATLQSHACCIRRLFVQIDDALLYQAVTRGFTADLPNLEQLCLIGDRTSGGFLDRGSDIGILGTAERQPKMPRISYLASHFDVFDFGFQFLDHLIELSIDESFIFIWSPNRERYVDQLVGTLNKCPNLVKLSIKGKGPDYEPPFESIDEMWDHERTKTIALLPNLRSLKVANMPLEQFLPRLYAPKILYLAFEGVMCLRNRDVLTHSAELSLSSIGSHLTKFIRELQLRIRFFSVSKYCISSATWITLLRTMPGLEILEIVNPDVELRNEAIRHLCRVFEGQEGITKFCADFKWMRLVYRPVNDRDHLGLFDDCFSPRPTGRWKSRANPVAKGNLSQSLSDFCLFPTRCDQCKLWARPGAGPLAGDDWLYLKGLAELPLNVHSWPSHITP